VRYFSLEMSSKDYLEKISIQQGHSGVLLEGNLGEFTKLVLLEDTLLELQCANGVLRFDVTREELTEALQKEEVALCSE
jgi:hypothetical protein